MDRTAALQELKAKLGPLDAYLRGRGIDIGANGRKHFRCLNPEHTDSTPSMNYLGGNVYCHGCKATYDIIDLMAAEKNMTAGQFIEWGYQEYGILPTGSITKAGKKADLGKPAPVIPDSPPAPKEDYSAYIDACHARIGELDLKQLRGLCSTIKRFKIGYDPAWHSHSNRGTWKALIIPNGKYAFTVRNMDPDADKNSRYDKTLGTHPIFNQEAFDGDAPVFITEGVFDALSIMEVGGEAVALEGLATGKLLQLLEQKKPAKPVILALDNDQRGQETEAELIADLSQRGIPFLQADLTGDHKDANEAFNSLEAVNFIQAVQNTINSIKSEEDRAREETRARYQGITAAANLETLGELTFIVNGASAIMGECIDESSAGYRKDPNEVLQKDGAEALKAAIDETIQETISARTAAETERKERTGAGMVDNFLQAVQTRRYEPMPTGITDIDRAIGGGFIRQQLVLLGAAPGAGKTALAQWIFEGMAKRGTSCIFLNLEMAQEQILARSISRIAAQQGAHIKPTDILQGYKWTNIQRQQVMGAAATYREEIAPRMIYNPQGVTANLDSILGYISQEAQRAEAAGEQAPVCVLDYLQLVSGTDREDAATVIKRAVAGLKAYAIKHNTLVFVIMAHNRESNKTGAVTMEAGRDTSALEYSADLQLALTYTLCMKRGNQKGKAPDELTEDEKRKLTLKITKGRFGGGGKSIDLLFNGETMTYTQTVKDFEAVQDYDGVRL